jgi:hypothetical protein
VSATLACGPFIDFEGPRFWMTVALFLALKPGAYYAFIQAFRYRVSRAIPMSVRRALGLTLARSGLGVLLVGAGIAVVVASGSDAALAWSWLYLYVARAAAWFVVGWWGAGLRGRRMVGWVFSGTLVNAGFDAAVLAGLLEGWPFQAAILAVVATFIGILHVVGRRASLRGRFVARPVCPRCEYSLLGNLSGRCPECGAAATAAPGSG